MPPGKISKVITQKSPMPMGDSSCISEWIFCYSAGGDEFCHQGWLLGDNVEIMDQRHIHKSQREENNKKNTQRKQYTNKHWISDYWQSTHLTYSYEWVLLLTPISAPSGNFSAWQQPFWERISKGHHTDLLNFELECTHTKTHAKIQTCKHSLTHVIMYIIPDTWSMQSRSTQDTGEAETVSLKSNHPHLDLSTLMSQAHHTHSHTPTLTPSPHSYTLCLLVTNTPLQFLFIFSRNQRQRSHDTM